jgi:hypothetical protein
MMAATIRTDTVFSVVSREPLFDDLYLGAGLPHANYDVSLDGTRFLMLKAAQAAELLVAHNWAAEVRARVEGARRR